MVYREDARTWRRLRDQEVADVRIGVVDDVRQDVQLADVPRVNRVGVEHGRVVDVGHDLDVLQPVLDDRQHLLRDGKGSLHVGRVLAELRERYEAQCRRRHHVLGRIEEQLLQLVGGHVVARHVVVRVRARLGLAQLDPDRRLAAERDVGLERDVALGLRAADLGGDDRESIRREHLLDLGDGEGDVGVLGQDRRCPAERGGGQQRGRRDTAHASAGRIGLLLLESSRSPRPDASPSDAECCLPRSAGKPVPRAVPGSDHCRTAKSAILLPSASKWPSSSGRIPSQRSTPSRNSSTLRSLSA